MKSFARRSSDGRTLTAPNLAPALRSLVSFLLLSCFHGLSRIFYRHEVSWVDGSPTEPWTLCDRIRVVAILNHTSLYEVLFAGAVPLRFHLRAARHGVVAVAEKTLKRPLVGKLFRFIAAHVVSVTRERDHTWQAVLKRIGPESMVLILPEGRMMRANGLDANGQPMTVRGGISDILEAVDDGYMLLAYSGGLHHVQVPGQLLPRLFQSIRMRFELVEVAAYKGDRSAEAAESKVSFKRRVVEDLERRRDLHCPVARPRP
jgi:1-acyl-sn-glycerol-3-phosphate acyltransferase